MVVMAISELKSFSRLQIFLETGQCSTKYMYSIYNLLLHCTSVQKGKSVITYLLFFILTEEFQFFYDSQNAMAIKVSVYPYCKFTFNTAKV